MTLHGHIALPPWVWATFALLAVAIAALWLPRIYASPAAPRYWTWPFALALALAVGSGVVNAIGAMVLVLLAAACRAARLATPIGPSVAMHLVMLGICAGLFAHVLPGFDNPRVLDGVRLGPDALPYTKYLNFDKGVVGLFLLGLYAPELAARRSRLTSAGWLWRFAVVAAIVVVATVAAGYARWDPKLPAWWPVWLAGMVFLTALPEEVVFRGVVQERLQLWLGESPSSRWLPAVLAGGLFGAAHVGGGWTYAVLAAIAGIGYGWIYAASGSIGAAVLAHTGLNLLHLVFFTYPALGGR